MRRALILADLLMVAVSCFFAGVLAANGLLLWAVAEGLSAVYFLVLALSLVWGSLDA